LIIGKGNQARRTKAGRTGRRADAQGDTTMTTIRTTAIAFTAAAAFIAAGSLSTADQAHAGSKVGAALLGGFVAGALITAATKPAYAAPSYGVVYHKPRCWNENQFAGYDYYGNPVYQTIRVCN
jgi:hypothetical protein